MERAVLLIGVGRPQGLEPLPATRDGIEAMRAWAIEQDLGADRVRVLSDEDGGTVTLQDVRDATAAFVDTGHIEQLLIHFCGHGLVVHGSEVWLLSDALRYGTEAISVGLTKRKAMWGLIPHVVMISDACRSAPSNLPQAEAVGASIFGDQPDGKRSFVDLLFATQLDAPALQIPDTTAEGRPYIAVYTNAVAAALSGEYPAIVEPDIRTGELVVKVGALYRSLPDVVTTKLAEYSLRWHQQPDGEISYDTGGNLVSRLSQGPDGADGTDDFDEVDGSPSSGDDGQHGGDVDGMVISDPIPPDHYDYIPGVREDEGFTFEVEELLEPEDAYGVVEPTEFVDPVEPTEFVDPVELVIAGLNWDYPVPLTGWPEIRVVGDDRAQIRSYIRLDQINDTFLVPAASFPVLPLVVTLGNGRVFAMWHTYNHSATVIVMNGAVADVIYRPAGIRDGNISPERARIGAMARRRKRWWYDDETPEELTRSRIDAVRRDPSLGVLVAHALFEMGRPELVSELIDESSLPDLYVLAGLDDPNPRTFPMYSRTWGVLGPENPNRRSISPNVFDSPWALYEGPKAAQVADLMLDYR